MFYCSNVSKTPDLVRVNGVRSNRGGGMGKVKVKGVRTLDRKLSPLGGRQNGRRQPKLATIESIVCGSGGEKKKSAVMKF